MWWGANSGTGTGAGSSSGGGIGGTGVLVQAVLSPDPTTIDAVGSYTFSDPLTGVAKFHNFHFEGVRGQSYNLSFVAYTRTGTVALGPFAVMVHA